MSPEAKEAVVICSVILILALAVIGLFSAKAAASVFLCLAAAPILLMLLGGLLIRIIAVVRESLDV